MTQAAHNIDDILLSQGQPKPEPAAQPIAEQEAPEQSIPDTQEYSTSQEEISPDTNSVEYVAQDTNPAVYDYGTPVTPAKKERVYSESEVNQMIRDRLARSKQPDTKISCR